MREHLAADCAIGVDRRVLHDGAIVLQITCDPPRPHMDMVGEINAGLTIYAGKGRAGNLQLRDIAGTVADAIRKLVNAIGHQNDPINLTTWTAKP